MDLKANLLEPLNRLQKSTEASLEQFGKPDLFSNSMQKGTIGIAPPHTIRFSYCCDWFSLAMDAVFLDSVLPPEQEKEKSSESRGGSESQKRKVLLTKTISLELLEFGALKKGQNM